MAHTSAHVAHTLAHHIDEVFGLMGNGNAYFLDALLTSTSATYTAVRHEAGAVVAADAHFRTSGRIAAATTTYGAGFTNTLTALAEAAQAKVPLVLVVGDEPTSGPRPWDVDQIAMASAVGVRTYTVGRVDAAAATVTAIEHALTYRVPVVLAIPYDVATLDIGEIPSVPGPGQPTPLAPSSEFVQTSLARLASTLAEAERPVLLAGRGAWLAGAERNSAPWHRGADGHPARGWRGPEGSPRFAEMVVNTPKSLSIAAALHPEALTPSTPRNRRRWPRFGGGWPSTPTRGLARAGSRRSCRRSRCRCFRRDIPLLNTRTVAVPLREADVGGSEILAYWAKFPRQQRGQRVIVGCNDQLSMREDLAKQINEAEKVHVVQVLKRVIEYQ